MKGNNHYLPSFIKGNTNTPGAFGDPGVGIGTKDPNKKKGKNSKPRRKKVTHRPGKWVTAIKVNHKGKTVRAKVWAYLDELG
jgi:hypothetical protein